MNVLLPNWIYKPIKCQVWKAFSVHLVLSNILAQSLLALVYVCKYKNNKNKTIIIYIKKRKINNKYMLYIKKKPHYCKSEIIKIIYNK